MNLKCHFVHVVTMPPHYKSRKCNCKSKQTTGLKFAKTTCLSGKTAKTTLTKSAIWPKRNVKIQSQTTSYDEFIHELYTIRMMIFHIIRQALPCFFFFQFLLFCYGIFYAYAYNQSYIKHRQKSNNIKPWAAGKTQTPREMKCQVSSIVNL